MTLTQVTSEVEFDADGKQTGYLRVPHSAHRSAYGWLPVPITVIKNGKGPTLVISAGVHGDEYEGQIAVSELAEQLKAEDINGRLILLPMMNFPATQDGCRVSPVDDGNLNRTYPGDAYGTSTDVIAHYHEEVILPLPIDRIQEQEPLESFLEELKLEGQRLVYVTALVGYGVLL